MERTTFDGVAYFKNIASLNKKMKKDGYHVGECTTPLGIQGVMEDFRKVSRFCLVDNAVPGVVTMNRAGGFFNRRSYSMHLIIRRDARRGLDDYDALMSELRLLYLQILSRILQDREKLEMRNCYLSLDTLRYTEPGPYGYGGSAGLYFVLSIHEPANLVYDGNEWE